eukprot:CAMPEP_0172415726 /NCGR_PEP_ID=MMETSP1064-20121228/2142_1 /TAXON_ID=202472 /ORGANISM="Aulacoseira subarctica , Strain CCAP 1002/5" /LENGTH=466 /DNA_ID=CAMNT_0013152893 /DNA_START=29 /DNA_END=1429 /DNA_ORIENTATION=-
MSKSGRPKFNPVSDMLAGAVMAGTSVPQLIAYAETVGYASYRGLSTAGPSLIAWGLATGSPWMNSGVTSMTALMAKVDLNGEAFLANHTEEDYVDLVAAYSFWVGLASIFLALVGFGKLAGLTPKPVSAGFKWGCALGVVVAALPNGILLMGSSTMKKIVSSEPALSSFLEFLKGKLSMCTGAVEVTKVFWAATHPQYWAVAPTLVFLVGTIWVMNGKSYLPKALPPGSEVIIATALATLLSSHTNYTGGIVGEIPALQGGGISLFNGALQIPVEIRDYKRILFETPIADQFGGSYFVLFFSACIFAAINVLSIMGIANTFESENGIKWSFKREMCAQGVACAAAGLVGSAPVSGSLSRSLVSRIAGTTSQFACIFTGLLWIFCMPYMSIMSPTPKAILSAVIMSAVIKGVCDPKDLKALKGLDAIEGWATALATALASPTIGFGFGIVLSIALSFFRTKEKSKTL